MSNIPKVMKADGNGLNHPSHLVLKGSHYFKETLSHLNVSDRSLALFQYIALLVIKILTELNYSE